MLFRKYALGKVALDNDNHMAANDIFKPAPLHNTLPHTSQSPAGSDKVITSADVEVVRVTPGDGPVVAVKNRPTYPAIASLLVIVPTIPCVVSLKETALN